ncbi:hypothetical protein HDC90_002910 [Pedobacter sp. AK013]|uniref:hypothetical protein n=1 Tax=Pedobacter sp. AK013 TaxID=2723071 RepID=UPI001607D2F5|nr:hypothetical protein [Pedobacter sp. AK013]MBB6238278.1 hypothetical protein [Pedobacter sp. AK013]
MKLSENLQKLLPYGYLFLVVMGILKESIFYYQIGINILKYTTIMDVLISPVATLTSNRVVLIATTIFILLSFAYPSYLAKRRNKKWAQNLSGLKNPETLSEAEVESHFSKLFIIVFAIGLLSLFLGIGLGEGKKLSEHISNNELTYDRKLNYSNGESEDIYLIGTNSIYYFYLSKGNRSIKVAPIGAIKNLEIPLKASINVKQ